MTFYIVKYNNIDILVCMKLFGKSVNVNNYFLPVYIRKDAHFGQLSTDKVRGIKNV